MERTKRRNGIEQNTFVLSREFAQNTLQKSLEAVKALGNTASFFSTLLCDNNKIVEVLLRYVILPLAGGYSSITVPVPLGAQKKIVKAIRSRDANGKDRVKPAIKVLSNSERALLILPSFSMPLVYRSVLVVRQNECQVRQT